MLMPTFNTPSSVAVIFPSSDIPLPLITKTSALVDLSQTLTVHLKLPYWQWLTRRIWVQLLV